MSKTVLMDELKSLLQASDATLRKHWASRIIDEKIPVLSLMGLLHGHEKTAQRFTWLIGDLLDADPDVVKPVMPMLFEMRDKMPFPGMERTVGKCFWYAGVSDELAAEAIPQLFDWLSHDSFVVSIKHYAAKALFDLAVENRIDAKALDNVLKRQTKHENKAHAGRMAKLRMKLAKTVRNKR